MLGLDNNVEKLGNGSENAHRAQNSRAVTAAVTHKDLCLEEVDVLGMASFLRMREALNLGTIYRENLFFVY